jgi:hypothetical protein
MSSRVFGLWGMLSYIYYCQNIELYSRYDNKRKFLMMSWEKKKSLILLEGYKERKAQKPKDTKGLAQKRASPECLK